MLAYFLLFVTKSCSTEGALDLAFFGVHLCKQSSTLLGVVLDKNCTRRLNYIIPVCYVFLEDVQGK